MLPQLCKEDIINTSYKTECFDNLVNKKNHDYHKNIRHHIIYHIILLCMLLLDKA